jgi:hypothetical protein
MQDAPQKSWFGRNWFWVVPLGCLGPLVGCGGLIAVVFSLVFGMIKSSAPYTESLAAAQADTRVQAALGQPIEPGFFVTGNINTSGSSGHADIAYEITGPQGTATVLAVADKTAGTWTFTTLEVQPGGSGERIDLLESKE